MIIETRTFSNYINVEVEIDSGKFDLGFCNISVAKGLRDHLREVADEIDDQIESIERWAMIKQLPATLTTTTTNTNKGTKQ